jgi:2-oxoglutarate ferredoxin oxidoreductase subunit alpha
MKNGIHMVESNEHDERGYRNETSRNRTKMMEKRMKKLKTARRDLIRSKIWGNKAADRGIIGCGSTLGPIKEAVGQLKDFGIKAKFLQIRTLWPFQDKEVRDFISTCKQVFVVDNNYQGQLAQLIYSQVRPKIQLKSILNYSGHTFRPKDIASPIQKAQ